VARLSAFAVIGGLGLLTAALVRPRDAGFAAAIVAMAFFMVTTGEWVARGMERMGVVAAGTAAGGAAALIGAGVVAAYSGSATAGLVAFVIAELVASAVYWTAARGHRPRPGVGGIRAMLGESWPIAVSSLAVFTFYANIDTIILGATRSEAEAGVYSAAYRVFLGFNIVAIFGAYSIFPAISRAADVSTPKDLLERTMPFLRMLVIYGTAIVAVSVLGAADILGLLFGPSYREGADAFVLLCISTSWYCVGYAVGYNLIAIGRSRRFSIGAAMAGGLALLLDLLLIPPFGIVGAGAATTVSVVLAAGVWIGGEALATRAAAQVLGALAAVTAGAVLAVAVPSTSVPIGAAMLAVAAVAAARTVLAARRAG
jgi:O-antigen/teichoic acid export membrane protein